MVDGILGWWLSPVDVDCRVATIASVRRVEGDSGGPEGSWEGRKEGRKTVLDGRKQRRSTVVVRGEPHSPNDDE